MENDPDVVQEGVSPAAAGAPHAMAGKTALVTGSTAGIGYETAKALAAMGAAVVVVGRNGGKTKAVRDEIERATGNRKTDFLVADLSSLAEIRGLAESFKERYGRLDVLVNNVGAIYRARTVTVDGFEATLAVNHLGPFYLTHLLLDRLKAAGKARIVNVSSVGHIFFGINLADLQMERFYWSYLAYMRSKLAGLLCTYRLAELLDGTGVTVNALHPGLVSTGIDMTHGIMRVSRRWFERHGLTPVAGAATSVYLASSPDVEGVSGRYFVRKRPARSSRLSMNKDLQRMLWDMTAALVGLA